jgi:ATP-dependent Lon protease
VRDLEELPAEVRAAVTFHPVQTMDEVLRLALVHGDFDAEPAVVAAH